MLRTGSMQRRAAALGLAAIALAACSQTPPPRWAEGGAPLEIPRAHWQRAGGAIDLLEDGRIFVEGIHRLTLDRAGRVFEPDGEPVAVLQPDGFLIGPDERGMGRIGMANASLPGVRTAWLSIGPRGEVIRYADDGERLADGIWTGCGPALRACTLVTHLVGLEEVRRRPRVSFGIGIGVGFGR